MRRGGAGELFTVNTSVRRHARVAISLFPGNKFPLLRRLMFWTSGPSGVLGLPISRPHDVEAAWSTCPGHTVRSPVASIETSKRCNENLSLRLQIDLRKCKAPWEYPERAQLKRVAHPYNCKLQANCRYGGI